MGGFAAPVHSDLQPAPAPVAAARTPEIDAPGLVERLEMSRAFLDDRAFAKLLRDNDLQLAEQLGRFGWRGSWVDDADYIAEFDRATQALQGGGDRSRKPPILPLGAPAASRVTPIASRPDIARPAGAGTVPPNVEAAMGIPSPQRTALRAAFQSTLAGSANQALGNGWRQIANSGEAATLTLANSRRLFDNHRNRFWKWARSDPAALQQLRSMGARFPEERGGGAINPKARTAPEIALPNGTVLQVTIDHQVERQTDPARALDPANLRLSTRLENTVGLRQLHVQDRFTNRPADWEAMPPHAGQTPAEPNARSPVAEPTLRGGFRTAITEAFSIASALAAVGQTADQLRQGKPVEAAKTAGIAIAITKFLQRFPKLGPVGLALGTLLGYDEHAENIAMRAGTFMENKSGSHLIGGVSASATALGVGFFQGVVRPVGSGLYAGATILKPTHASFPSLGPGSSRFKARIDTHNEGCQTCHDAVRVDNWAKEHPEMTRLLNGPGSIGGVPTDELLKVFEANAFPLNERLP